MSWFFVLYMIGVPVFTLATMRDITWSELWTSFVVALIWPLYVLVQLAYCCVVNPNGRRR